MKNIPDFLTRYYVHGENPFNSLNDYPFEQACEIKKKHCIRNNISGFYAEDDYLIQRKEIEKWIYNQLVTKGGNPQNTVPVYMALGESPQGDFDIRVDLQKNADEIKIPIKCLDLSAISFTFPDSMYRFVTDSNGNIVGGERTNTPIVYLYSELEEVISRYKTDLHYIEAQVWNREMLFDYLKGITKQ
ncbi:MAG: hypothetical protein K0R15_1748 [Clostridiales bacterium]|jgi:hypothetical protein|nr:hypothetical protein [Clostridiales bacterium]